MACKRSGVRLPLAPPNHPENHFLLICLMEQIALFPPIFPPIEYRIAFFCCSTGYCLSGDPENTEEYERRAICMAPSFRPARLGMSAIVVIAGRLGDAKEHMADLRAFDLKYSFQRCDERYPYRNPEHRDPIAVAAKAAGLT